ncbi:hypothetical protein L7F22_058436 [Adiantum nelumboides]|nr:hypothetical protein [Adiantum nelumboides]
MVEVSPHKGSGKKIKVVRYDMKTGKQGKMKFETSTDEFSSSTYSTTIEEEPTTSDESDSSGEEAMGLILTEPNKVDPPDIPRVEESKLAKMLAKDLTKEEKQAYLTMLKDFPRLFIEGYDQITGVTVARHHIKLKEGSKPTVQRLQRLGVIQQDALLAEIRKLLNAGFIYPVEWVSPVVVTPKKNGKWRVCVDYKPLNAATKRDHFSLPFQDEILNEVAGYERYTMCDGYSGYFQIRIAEEDQKKTTFATPWGCFAYRVMPSGLTNAPTTFQRFVTHVFQPFFGKSIRVFIDDFCIYSSRALHIEKVHENLSRLQSMGGQLNIDKCHIGEAQVTLLGLVVFARGIEADPVGKFRPYLLPKKFVILTLEENFLLVLQHMDVSARISKWLVRLQEFEYTVQVENSTRVSLAGLLTHRCYEKKLKVNPTMVKVEEEISKLGEAHSLYFDGAYKRKVDKAAVGVVIYDEEGRKVFGKGLMLENVHSNNEAEYVALSLGLEWCLNLGIKRLNAFGDALLLVKQVHGTWACRNQGLVVRLRRVKELLKRFEVAHLLHAPRKDNQEADALASEQLQDVIIGAVALQQPQFQGSDCMPDILHFLETGECPEGLSKGEIQWLVFVVGISHMTLLVGKYFKQAERRRQKFNEGLKDKELKRGMLVLRYDNRFDNRKDKKFLSRWEGPFLIRKKYSNVSYQLQEINGRLHKTRVNGWRLKPYFQRFDSELWLELPPETEEDEEKGSSSIPCYEDPEERLET